MSSSALISLGSRSMTAAYAQLQTTSNNISNASVAGYSRQQVQLATAPASTPAPASSAKASTSRP